LSFGFKEFPPLILAIHAGKGLNAISYDEDVILIGSYHLQQSQEKLQDGLIKS